MPKWDARALLRSLTGKRIWTVTGQANTVLRLEGDDVIVATSRSPLGQPVPVDWVQSGLDRLWKAREIEVSVASLGYRSSFIGAVLLSLPDTVLLESVPPRIGLDNPTTSKE